MSTWYHSFYWRIALAFMLCLAAMLVVQGMLFVWVASRVVPPLPGPVPGRLARMVADELGPSLERDPSLDIGAYLRAQHGREATPLFVVLRDSRSFSSVGGGVPQPLLDVARAALRAAEPAAGRPTDGERRPDSLRGPGGTPFGARGRRMGPLGPGAGRAPIVVGGDVVGVVVLPPRPPFGFLLRRFAPTLALVAFGALVVGAVLVAVVVFGPARRRLRAVEEAAGRLGRGDLTARAPAHGRDEIAAVASAFNAMADGLAARADALDRSNRVRRQLLADVSHELTTPVTAMRGYLETLSMPELALDPQVRSRYLTIVADETSRLERIIGDLLDLARLEDGGGSFAVEQVPAAQLLDRVVARHERDARDAGVNLVTRIDPGAELIVGDAGRLEQALQNLTANALRHAPAGTSVELVVRLVRGGVAISVTDAGPGIAHEHLPHLFDRFYKAEPSRARGADAAGRPSTSGSGLGLSIVKAIVERHGGRLAVTSEPGRTTFDVTLPQQTTGASVQTRSV